MANPDREFLDRIERAWDDRVERGESVNLNADGIGETIDALHQADIDARPSDEFRYRLRRQLVGGAPGNHSNAAENDVTVDAGEPPTGASDSVPSGGETMSNRRWWLSHLGELAAMLLILLIVAAGAVIWQSGGNGDGDELGNQPGGAGNPGDASEEVAVPTPMDGHVWTELTLEQAQSITPFDLVLPDPLPDGYEVRSIRVIDLGAAPDNEFPEREDGASWVYAALLLTPADEANPEIEFVLGNFRIGPMMPGMPDSPNATEPAAPYDEETQLERLDIDGVQVNRVVRTFGEDTHESMDARSQTMYAWNQDGLGMLANYSTDLPVDAGQEEADQKRLESMIESIILQRTSDEEPPQPPGTITDSESDSASATAEPESQPEIHRAISFEEAQERTPFELVDPRRAQDVFDVGSVMLNEPPNGDRYHATLHMHSPDGQSFEFIQENAPSQPPRFAGDVEGADPEDGAEEDRAEIEIDSLTVTRTRQGNVGGDQIVIYTWNQDELGMSVFAVTGTADSAAGAPMESAEEVEAFVRAIVEARESDEAPEQSGQQGEASAAVGEGDPDSLTLEEARRAVPFELVDVSALPDDLQPQHIDAMRYEDGSVVEPDHPEAGNSNRVHMHLTTPPGHEPVQIVELIQMTEEFDNPEGAVMEIDGHEFERVAGQTGEAFEVGYIWKAGETNVGLLVTTIPPNGEESLSDIEPPQMVTEEDMEQFVRSTLP